MAVSALQFAEPSRVRIEREFRNRGTALRACPVSLEHLALSAIISHVISHCCLYYDYADK